MSKKIEEIKIQMGTPFGEIYEYILTTDAFFGNIGIILQTYEMGLKDTTLDRKAMRVDREQFIIKTEQFITKIKMEDEKKRR